MISKTKRQKIFGLCKLLGIDDDTRRQMQYNITGKESTTEMSSEDAAKVIKELKRHLPKKQHRKFKTPEESIRPGNSTNALAKGNKTIQLMTPEMRKKIISMSIHIYGKFSEEKFNAFCQKTFKKNFNSLTASDALKAIEIQKSILARKTKNRS